jgi:hypothetical protein
MKQLPDVQAAYFAAFSVAPPEPFGVDDERIAAVLAQAVIDKQPIPDSFDWWGRLPPQSVA